MRTLFTILFLALVTAAPAQDLTVGRYDQVNREALNPATMRGSVSFRTRNGTSEFTFVEADLSLSMTGLHGWVDDAQPHRARTLSNIAEDTGALAAAGLDDPVGIESFGLSDVRMIDGRIYSWPPSGNHLVIWPDGHLTFEEWDGAPAVLRFDSGTSIPLRHINGPFSGEVSEPVMYTGRLSGLELPLAAVPGDATAVVLRSPNRTSPPAIFGGTDRAPLEIVRLTTMSELDLRPPEAVLFLPMLTPPSILSELVEGAEVRVDLSVPQRLRLAQAILPVGRRITTDGRIAPGVDPASDAVNAIGLDPSGRRFIYLSALEQSGRRFGAGIERIADFFADEGFTESMEVPGAHSMLLADATDRRLRSMTGVNTVRSALLILPYQPALRDPIRAEGLHRIEGLIVAGTRREFPHNSASSANDGRLHREPALSGFWAAPILESSSLFSGDTQATNAIQILLPRTMPVTAIELVHADALGFSPDFNVKGWRLLGRSPGSTRWQTLTEVSHDSPVGRERVFLDGEPVLQELSFEITQPNFLPPGNVARLAEIIFWSKEQTIEGAPDLSN